VKKVWDLGNTNRWANIHIIGVSEGEEREKGTESLFEEMREKSPNLGKVVDFQIQKAQKISIRMNTKKSTPIYTISKLSETQKEFWKQQEKNDSLHTKKHPQDYKWISQQKLCRPEENGMIYLKSWKEKLFRGTMMSLPPSLLSQGQGELSSE